MDKTNNSFGIVCKKFYLHAIKKNLAYQMLGAYLVMEYNIPLLYWTSK